MIRFLVTKELALLCSSTVLLSLFLLTISGVVTHRVLVLSLQQWHLAVSFFEVYTARFSCFEHKWKIQLVCLEIINLFFFNSSNTHSVMKKKSSSISYHRFCEGVSKNEWWTVHINSHLNPYDVRTKSLPNDEKRTRFASYLLHYFGSFVFFME